VGLRAAVLAGVTVAAAAAVSGCSTGQVNQTAYMATAIGGVNQTFAVDAPPGEQDGSIAIRDMLVSYDGTQGYKKGGDAPLQLGIFNDTTATLKVTITAPGTAQSVTFKAGGAAAEKSAEPAPSPSVAPSKSAKPSASKSGTPAASASAEPTEVPKPPTGPASFTIASGQFIMLAPQYGQFLVLQGLANDVKPGDTLKNITFQFQLDGDQVVVPAPLSPAPQASPVSESCIFNGTSQVVCRAPMGTPSSPQPRQVPTGGTEHE
jgi:hypothetical protein